MKICIIGGIFLKGGARSSYIKSTPETILEDGLRSAGHEVTTLSHYDDVDFSQFDVVHAHHLSYGAARMASDRSKTPFLFTVHDGSYMMGIPPTKVHQAFFRFVASRSDAVVSLSNGEAEFQRKHYPAPSSSPSVTISNGISAKHFPFTPRSERPNDPCRLLFAAQLIPIKGCDILLKACASLQRPFHLSLAYQTAALEQEMKQLASALGISDRVDFLGKVDPAQLAQLHRSHDVLILPSSTEALPSVITESMYSGLPFIASPVGGVPEQAAGYGYLLKQRTPQGVVDAIEHVLAHYPDFVSRAEEMSNHARATFSIPAMIDKHIALYQSVIGKEAVRHRASSAINAAVRFAVRQRGRRGPGKAARWAHEGARA